MKRVILIVLGVFLLLFSVPLLVGGVVMAVWAGGDDPTIQGKIGRIESSGSAVVSDTVQVESSWPMADWWDVTVSVQHPNSDTPVFIGYGPTSSVDAYLAGAPYTIVTSIGGGHSSGVRGIDVPGTVVPQPPDAQGFWIEQASGVGRQAISVAPEQGDYRFVAMNADASAGVSLSVYGSMKVPFLVPIGIGGAAFGVLLAIVGLVLLVVGLRSEPAAARAAHVPPGYGPGEPGAGYPVAPYPGTPYPGTPYPGTPYPGTQYPGTPDPGTQAQPGAPYAGTQAQPAAPYAGTPAQPAQPYAGTPAPLYAGTQDPASPSAGQVQPGVPLAGPAAATWSQVGPPAAPQPAQAPPPYDAPQAAQRIPQPGEQPDDPAEGSAR